MYRSMVAWNQFRLEVVETDGVGFGFGFEVVAMIETVLIPFQYHGRHRPLQSIHNLRTRVRNRTTPWVTKPTILEATNNGSLGLGLLVEYRQWPLATIVRCSCCFRQRSHCEQELASQKPTVFANSVIGYEDLILLAPFEKRRLPTNSP